jgi:hypothetical protein
VKSIAKITIIALMVSLVFQPTSAMAAANPQFDVTGVWKNSAGQTLQLFQEKDEINGVFVNSGFGHRMEGRYVSATKAKLILIRRTRPNVCETTMTLEITVNGANAMVMTSVAAENGCGLTTGQSFPGQLTRVL